MMLPEPTPKERAITALELKPPLPGKVPTFELEFQLTQELLGKEFYRETQVWEGATTAERERMIRHNADLYIEVAERLDYAIIMIVGPHSKEDIAATANHIRRQVDDRYLLICHGDATFAIPSGDEMEAMAVSFFERPDEMHHILEAEPHGLHSIDCQAVDMDLAVIKKQAGRKVCLLGGVQCSLLQTGTEEEIVEQCRYVLRHGMPGGGYIYGATNVAFKGLPLERYLLVLEMRERFGWYDAQGVPGPDLFKGAYCAIPPGHP